MAHADVGNELRGHFESFMASRPVEEIYLLEIILSLCETGTPLAESFAHRLEASWTYIQVPYEHKARVEKFIKCLPRVAEAC